MLSANTLSRLIAHVTPAIAYLVRMPGMAGLPPLRGVDEAAVGAWFQALAPGQQRQFLGALGEGAEPVDNAMLELVQPAVGQGPAAPLIPAQPPHRTRLNRINVDREPMWHRLIELHEGAPRILLVHGERKHGKSQAFWLARELRVYLPKATHLMIAINVDGLQTLAEVIARVLSELGATAADTPPAGLDSTNKNGATSLAAWLYRTVMRIAGARTPWLVFDHFHRLPDNSEHTTFVNTLAEKVAEYGDEPNAMRLVLVDHRDVPGTAVHMAIPEMVERVAEHDVAVWLRRNDVTLTEPDAAARAHTMFTEADAEATAKLAAARPQPDAEVLDPLLEVLATKLVRIMK